mgnify:FL=1
MLVCCHQVTTAIKPQDNSLLEGLYKSGGNYCTQVRTHSCTPQHVYRCTRQQPHKGSSTGQRQRCAKIRADAITLWPQTLYLSPKDTLLPCGV